MINTNTSYRYYAKLKGAQIFTFLIKKQGARVSAAAYA